QSGERQRLSPVGGRVHHRDRQRALARLRLRPAGGGGAGGVDARDLAGRPQAARAQLHDRAADDVGGAETVTEPPPKLASAGGLDVIPSASSYPRSIVTLIMPPSSVAPGGRSTHTRN